MGNIEQKKEEETTFWDLMAKKRIYAAFDKDEYQKAIDFIGKGRKKVLDNGCASGISAAMLADQGYEVIGTDISPELINQANNLWKDMPNKPKFKVGDAENLPFNKNVFDVVFFGGVIHHFPDYSKMIEDSRRVLKKGGIILAIEPNVLDFIERIEWKIAGWRKKLSPNEYPLNPVLLKKRMEKQGFEKVKIIIIRKDIPFLAQLPIFKHFFDRKKGFLIKKPVLFLINLFRKSPLKKGNFFIIYGEKK